MNIFGQDFPGIEIGQLLVELNKKVAPRKSSIPLLEKQPQKVIEAPAQQKLSQDVLWNYISRVLKRR
ncbi:hypothetical protein ABVN80_10280 [Acinetobacter baumannii]